MLSNNCSKKPLSLTSKERSEVKWLLVSFPPVNDDVDLSGWKLETDEDQVVKSAASPRLLSSGLCKKAELWVWCTVRF